MAPANDPFCARLASIPGVAREHVEAASRLQSLGLPRIVQARVAIEEDREPASALFIVRRGWAFASKLLPNGSRQVLDFYLAGDVIGSAKGFRKTAAEGAETVTETVVSEISLDAVRRLARQSPAVMDVMIGLLAQERASLAERLVDLGRRDSVARVAHLLLELWRRLSVVGLASPLGYSCPLSQYLIADATGLTAIHVNRVLRALREGDLLTFRHGQVRFHDFDRLAQLSGIEPELVGRPLLHSVEAHGIA
jgi:CRP-like cAMP-binding protein